MFSFFNCRNRKPKKEPDKAYRWVSWQSLSTAARLNILTAATSILDMAYFFASINNSFNTFVKNTPAFSISFYCCPSFISLFATLYNKNRLTPPSATALTKYSEDSQELLITLAEGDSTFEEFLIDHPTEIRKLLDKFELYNSRNNTDTTDISAQTFFFFIRALRGATIFLELVNITSEHTKNTISEVATYTYGAVYMLHLTFFIGHLLYKLIRHHNVKELLDRILAKAEIKVPTLDFGKDIEAEAENKVKLLH